MKIKTADDPMGLVNNEFQIDTTVYNAYSGKGFFPDIFGVPLFVQNILNANRGDADLIVTANPHNTKWQVHVIKWRLSDKFYAAFSKGKKYEQ